VNRNVEPRPSSLSTETRPPCASTNCLTMARPRPVPPFSAGSVSSLSNTFSSGDILILECAIEELPLLAESLEDDLTAANQQYRERLLRQGSRNRQAGPEGQERERTDDDAAINKALGKLKKR
jgi:hypothetical protein